MYQFLFWCAVLFSGCVPNKINTTDAGSFLPKDKSFTLRGDFNSSSMLHFRELFPIRGLDFLVKTGLENSPNWKVQLAKLEMIKVRSGLDFVDSKPKLSTRLGWLEGKEKTRESNYKKQPIPNLQAAASFNWEIDLWGKMETTSKCSKVACRRS